MWTSTGPLFLSANSPPNPSLQQLSNGEGRIGQRETWCMLNKMQHKILKIQCTKQKILKPAIHTLTLIHWKEIFLLLGCISSGYFSLFKDYGIFTVNKFCLNCCKENCDVSRPPNNPRIALLPICISHQRPLPSCSKIIFCAFVFNPWAKLFMRNGFL